MGIQCSLSEEADCHNAVILRIKCLLKKEKHSRCLFDLKDTHNECKQKLCLQKNYKGHPEEHATNVLTLDMLGIEISYCLNRNQSPNMHIIVLQGCQ